MNKTLVAKWIYGYANCQKDLWKKVVCAHSNGNSNSLMLSLENRDNNLVLLRFVELVIGKSDQAMDVIDHQFRILIADG